MKGKRQSPRLSLLSANLATLAFRNQPSPVVIPILTLADVLVHALVAGQGQVDVAPGVHPAAVARAGLPAGQHLAVLVHDAAPGGQVVPGPLADEEGAFHKL